MAVVQEARERGSIAQRVVDRLGGRVRLGQRLTLGREPGLQGVGNGFAARLAQQLARVGSRSREPRSISYSVPISLTACPAISLLLNSCASNSLGLAWAQQTRR